MERSIVYPMDKEEVKRMIEHAPADPGTIAYNLEGWWVSTVSGDVFLCAKCYGRLVQRGCALQASPVWGDRPEPKGVCVGCTTGGNDEK